MGCQLTLDINNKVMEYVPLNECDICIFDNTLVYAIHHGWKYVKNEY